MKIPLPPVPLDAEVVEAAREIDEGARFAVGFRDAATVVLMRPSGDDGPEVYLLRRHTAMDFAGGMAVFPGGGVDPRDFAADVAWAGPTPEDWARRLGCEVSTARALVCAAVRETFEEAGVLFAGDSPATVVADITGADWESDRLALVSHEMSMTELLRRRGLVLRTDLLGAWDGWLTPAFEPRRYRTWFFVAVLPEGQRTRDVSTESSSVSWMSAGAAAAEAEAGRLAMLPPTYLTCLELDRLGSAADVMGSSSGRSVAMFTPTVEPLGDGFTLSMPERLRPLVAERVR